jgi:hypothetical protein
MSKDPSVLFYTSDFLTGTRTMSDAQRGKYIVLLCLQHQQGPLNYDDMIKICKTYDDKIFSKFIKTQDNKYYNERMRAESERRKKYSISRSKNRTNISKSYDTSYVEHMENETLLSSNNIIVSFEKFWNLYDVEEDKIQCETLWMQLDNSERIECIQKLPEYIKSTIDKQFRKSPKSFIKNKAWRNEIIKRNGSPQPEIVTPKFSSGPGR